jgi:hypothetical protein
MVRRVVGVDVVNSQWKSLVHGSNEYKSWRVLVEAEALVMR